MKQILAAMICCSLLLVICSTELYAKIYRYVDEKGTTVFVDDESKIPLKYRPETSKIHDETEGMSAEEIKAYEKSKQLEQEREANKLTPLFTRRCIQPGIYYCRSRTY